MGKLTRACLLLFIVFAILSIGVLAIPWFQWHPFNASILFLKQQSWFSLTESVLLAFTALGLLTLLGYALFSPSKKGQLEFRYGNGTITISKDAIESTVKHVVEQSRGITVSNIAVRILGSSEPRVSIRLKVNPGRNSELGKLGVQLQEEISASVCAFAGYPIHRVDITFSGDAEVVTPAFTKQAVKDAQTPANTNNKTIQAASLQDKSATPVNIQATLAKDVS